MVTNFPAQIDSFAIHAPEEIISHLHVNNLQDAMVAVQVYAKSVEETLKNHITQTVAAHLATAIAVNNISGLDTTNVQTALADLKAQLEVAIVFFSTTLDAYYTVHIAEDIDLAHPNGLFPGSRLTAASITGSKIALGTINENHLSFDLATQAELDAHISANIATAHPNGTFPIARLDTDVATQAELDAHISANIATAHPNGTFPIARLDTDVATQAELDTHISTSVDVHGVGLGSSIVGTLTTQTLENKKIVSDFDGNKVLLFTTDVSDTEKTLYSSTNYASSQLEVRQKALSSIVSTDHTGLVSTIQVADSSFFSDVEGISNGIEFIIPPSLSGVQATITSIPDSTTLILDNLYPSISATTHYIINKTKEVSLFYINQDGYVFARELHVVQGVNEVSLNDDVTIQGTLTVTGTTLLQDDLTIQGNQSTTGSFSALGLSSNASTTTISSSSTSIAGSASIAGSLTIGNDLTITDQTNMMGSLHVFQNEIIDGYLNINQSATIIGNVNVGNFLVTGGGIHTNGGLSADGTITSKGGIFTDGYSIISDDLVVIGNLDVTGTITQGGVLPATSVTFDIYDANNTPPNIVMPIVNTNVQAVLIELEQNLESYIYDAYSALLANNQALPADVVGLFIDSSIYRAAFIDYSMYRNDPFPDERVCVGTLRIAYKSTGWIVDDTYTGDYFGVTFSVTSLGQVKYTSTLLPGTVSSTLKFKVRTTKQ